MPTLARCPYCVEGVGFKVMTGNVSGYRCARCGHVKKQDDPDYACDCANCAKLSVGQPARKKTPL